MQHDGAGVLQAPFLEGRFLCQIAASQVARVRVEP